MPGLADLKIVFEAGWKAGFHRQNNVTRIDLGETTMLESDLRDYLENTENRVDARINE